VLVVVVTSNVLKVEHEPSTQHIHNINTIPIVQVSPLIIKPEMRFFVLFLLAAIIIATSAYDKSEVLSSITKQQLVEVCQTNGFGFELIEGHDNLLRVIISGMKGTVIISESSLQYYAASSKVGSPEQMLQIVNQWNTEKRFSRSYVDRDGDPVLELDLDMNGGVTYQRLEDFLATVTKSVLAWTMHMTSSSSLPK
jgi:hypothetical protein